MKTVIEMARLATNGRVAKNDAETESLVGLDEVTRFAELVRADTRNATLDEIANKINADWPRSDTAASFAIWIREMKT